VITPTGSITTMKWAVESSLVEGPLTVVQHAGRNGMVNCGRLVQV
jgi:hypothetical protein